MTLAAEQSLCKKLACAPQQASSLWPLSEPLMPHLGKLGPPLESRVTDCEDPALKLHNPAPLVGVPSAGAAGAGLLRGWLLLASLQGQQAQASRRRCCSRHPGPVPPQAALGRVSWCSSRSHGSGPQTRLQNEAG